MCLELNEQGRPTTVVHCSIIRTPVGGLSVMFYNESHTVVFQGYIRCLYSGCNSWYPPSKSTM